MRLIGKLVIIIFIVGILLGASAYVILYTEDDDHNNNGGHDTEPPQIIEVSGDLTVTAGQTATITASFTDNVNVTEATLYYQTAGSTSWNSISILSGSASINIPSGVTSNYYYYITVNDAADTGPVGNPSTDGSKFYIITVIKPMITRTLLTTCLSKKGPRPPANIVLISEIFSINYILLMTIDFSIST